MPSGMASYQHETSQAILDQNGSKQFNKHVPGVNIGVPNLEEVGVPSYSTHLGTKHHPFVTPGSFRMYPKGCPMEAYR